MSNFATEDEQLLGLEYDEVSDFPEKQVQDGLDVGEADE